MKLAHDELKEILPDYLRGSMSEDVRKNLRAHVDECQDCEADLLLLSDIIDADSVPDPGELFFKTLPQRVRALAQTERRVRFSFKSLFLRPVAIAASMAVITLAIYLFKDKTDIGDASLFFKDPLTVTMLDYSSIPENDIPIIDEYVDLDSSTLGYKGIGHGYYIDIASLSSKEAEGLVETLKKEQANGG